MPRRRISRVPARSALRVSGRQVETAVWSLRHPVTRRTVTLLGTMHIGDVGYFARLSAELAEVAATGAEIHLEGINHGGEERLTAIERARLAEAAGWEDPETTGVAVSLLRLESQSSHLILPPATRNIDLSHGELLRRVGWNAYRRLFAPGPAGPAGPSGPAFGPLVRAVIRFQLRHSGGLDRVRSLTPAWRRLNRVVVGERNRVAFAGALEALARTDVALVWGCDHLPGLARLLQGAGYRPESARWLAACTV